MRFPPAGSKLTRVHHWHQKWTKANPNIGNSRCIICKLYDFKCTWTAESALNPAFEAHNTLIYFCREIVEINGGCLEIMRMILNDLHIFSAYCFEIYWLYYVFLASSFPQQLVWGVSNITDIIVDWTIRFTGIFTFMCLYCVSDAACVCVGALSMCTGIGHGKKWHFCSASSFTHRIALCTTVRTPLICMAAWNW